MKRIFLFNPENDVALGYGKCRVTMSPLVRRLHDDGALLPIWFANRGDRVYVSNVDTEWLESVSSLFGLDVSAGTDGDGFVGAPWGWSYDSLVTLRNVGAIVPDEMQVEQMRMLSHRRTTITVMQRLREMPGFDIVEQPCEAFSISDLQQCLDEWGKVYVKSPWSSSGRGVFQVDRIDERVTARVNAIIRKQGSVLVERAQECIQDFAMLFFTTKDTAKMVGYSVFFNDRGNAYGGNIMMDDSSLEDIIVEAGADRMQLRAIAKALEAIFSELIAPVYQGYFGVDMMVVRGGMLAPCVEINLRMTMGVVASIWYKRYMRQGAKGVYRVEPCRGDKVDDATSVVVDGKLVHGKFQLTPSSGEGFVFSVEIID